MSGRGEPGRSRGGPELVVNVRSVRLATPSTRYVRLALDGARFRYAAGQAVMLGLAERTERIPYSIANAPEEAAERGELEFLIKIEPSGRWGHQFDSIARGQRIGLRGPIGSFVLPARAERAPLLFIAGGTGIAPVRSMIRHVRRRRRGGLKLLYSARTAADFAYLGELRALVRDGGLVLRLHATREARKGWRGERRRIAPAHLLPLVEDRRTLCFVCGPAPMVADVPLMLQQLGVPARNIKLEQWST